MSTIRKIFIHTFLVFCILFVSFQVSAGTQPYSDTAENFAIEIPTDWQIRSQYLGTAVMALSPQTDPADTFPENVNVVTEALQLDMSVQEYYDANLVSMKGMLTDLSVSEALPLSLAGTQAIQMTATHTMKGFHAKVLGIFLTHNKKGYVITCTATPQTFDQYKAAFQTIISTFKFLQ